MKKKEIVGLVLGGVCLAAAVVLVASNERKPVFGSRETEYFVMEVGKGVSDIGHRNRTIGEIREVWASRQK